MLGCFAERSGKQLSCCGVGARRREDTRVTEAERAAEVSGSHQKQAGWRQPAVHSTFTAAKEDVTTYTCLMSKHRHPDICL